MSKSRQILVMAVLFIALAGLTTQIWRLNQAGEDARVVLLTEAAADHAAERLTQFLTSRLGAVQTISEEWREGHIGSREEFADHALQVQSIFGGFQAVNWINTDGVITWVVPEKGNLPALGHDLHEHSDPGIPEALERARRLGQPQIGPPIELFQGGAGFVAHVPLGEPPGAEGFIAAVFHVARLVGEGLGGSHFADYHVALSDGETLFFQDRDWDETRDDRHLVVREFSALNRIWQAKVQPSAALLAEIRSPHDEVLLVVGLVFSAMITLLAGQRMRHRAADMDNRQRLAESEQRHRLLVENVNDGIGISQQSTLIFANRRLAEMLGHTLEELVSMQSRQIFTPSAWEHVEERAARRERGEVVPERYESTLRTRDGADLEVEISVRVIDYQGRPASFGVFRDISQRREAEEALRRREEVYRRAIRAASGYPYEDRFDEGMTSGRYTFLGEGMEDLVGVPRDQFDHARMAEITEEVEILDPRHRGDRRGFRRAFLSGKMESASLDVRIRTPQGETRWLSDHSIPVRDEKTGKVTGSLGILQDISERKRQEELLAVQNQVAQAVTGSLSPRDLCDRLLATVRGVMPCDAFIVNLYDMETGIAQPIRAYDTIDGQIQEVERVEASIAPARPLYTRAIQRREPLLEHRSDPEDDAEDRIRFGDMERLSASILWVPVVVKSRVIGLISAQSYTPEAYTDRHVELMMAIAHQLGPALEAAVLAQQLSDSEQKFRTLAENMPGAVYLCLNDERGTVLYLSEAIEDLTGLPAAEFTDGYASLAEFIHPEDASVRGHLDEALRRGRAYHFIYRVRHVDRGWRWVEEHGQGVFDAFGNRRLLEGTLFDITAQREAKSERERLQGQLLQAQKLESLGVLAGGIAHDFNNLLTGILGNAQLIALDLSSNHPAQEALSELTRAADRASALTHQMLAYTGRGSFVVQPIDLSVHVREISHLLRSSISKKVKLRLDLAEGLPAVEADATQIQQLVMNLVINAAEAIGDGTGTVHVSTLMSDPRPTPGPGVHVSDEFRPGPHVQLIIRDSGDGMDEETLSKIFDPFFTTKFAGRGLGLAAVIGIVRGHRATLEVKSEPGHGTAFTIHFPASDRPTTRIAPGGVGDLRGHGRILVIDDEELVRTLAISALGRWGHHVETAESGAQALQMFADDARGFDLVLVDMTMPDMDGVETLHEMRRIRGDVRAILMSGYSARELAQRSEAEGFAAFLQKPFSPTTLGEAVKSALSDQCAVVPPSTMSTAPVVQEDSSEAK